MATKTPTKKTTGKKSPAKKAPAKKPVKKTAKTAKNTKTPKKRTIAQRQTLWKSGTIGYCLRWIAIPPLGALWYIFTYMMAGYSFTALVCMCLIGILLFYNLCYLTMPKYPKTTRVVKSLFTIVLCIGILIVGITEILIIHTSFGDKDEDFDYMLVLGAKVRQDGPSVSLMDRIKATAAYMEAHPEVIAIVSGGQGPDEPMTEAQCMYEQLVKLGVDPDRIWLEDKATSTWENLHFTMNLIEEKTGHRPEKIGLLSSEYHLFRAKMFARACGVEAAGIPARTSRLSQMVNHFMREVAGVWHYIILGGQYHD